jgi:hypothetical protein
MRKLLASITLGSLLALGTMSSMVAFAADIVKPGH